MRFGELNMHDHEACIMHVNPGSIVIAGRMVVLLSYAT